MEPIRLVVDWRGSALHAHDAVCGLRCIKDGETAAELAGPARVLGDSILAAWFRLSPKADEEGVAVRVDEMEVVE